MLLFRPHPTSLLLLWVCIFGKQVSSQTDCNCPGGCNLTDVCYTTDCSEKNVAVGKRAESSLLFSNSYAACLAVNGITDSDDDCVETAQNDVNPFWRVDLGQTYTVQHMTIYGRAKWLLRMRGLKMYVDNQLCNTIGNESYYTSPGDRPVPIHVQCNTTRTGRHVTLLKNFTETVNVFHYEILSVCEVQVWAKPPPTTTTTIATTSTTTAPIIYPKTTPTARTAITAVPSGLTSKTSIAISNSSTMTRPKEDSPQNTSTDTLVTVIAGAVGAVVALLIAAIIAVFVVMRKKRSKTPDPGNSTANSAAHPADNDDVTTGGFVSVTEDHTTDNDTASTTDNVYEIIEESGHYYEPLSHRDNTYINDNTM